MYDYTFDDTKINERRERYELLINLILEKVNNDSLDLKKVSNQACHYGSLDIVKLVLENMDHKKIVLNHAYCYGLLDIVTFLLENTDHKMLDVKKAMNIVNDIIIDNMDYNDRYDEEENSEHRDSYFDVNKLIGISCKNSGNASVMMFLIENFDLTQAHIDIIIKNACKYSWTEIVTSILDSCKHNKNLMEEATKNACNSGETEIAKILLDNVDVGFIEIKRNAMIIPCQKGWDELVFLL
ncbi:unnamed protein product [Mytilus coruscus]|uniref:Ankyrin repeat protein n=1 Tax=Mytilus coruscus TaxID=42192 RepID=A0A6J8DE61_MYTCO|nr:unnamed protein product [Mytilus coruscus]